METEKQEARLHEQNCWQLAALADLPLTAAQAEAAKGGEGTSTTAGQWPWQLSTNRVGG